MQPRNYSVHLSSFRAVCLIIESTSKEGYEQNTIPGAAVVAVLGTVIAGFKIVWRRHVVAIFPFGIFIIWVVQVDVRVAIRFGNRPLVGATRRRWRRRNSLSGSCPSRLTCRPSKIRVNHGDHPSVVATPKTGRRTGDGWVIYRKRGRNRFLSIEESLCLKKGEFKFNSGIFHHSHFFPPDILIQRHAWITAAVWMAGMELEEKIVMQTVAPHSIYLCRVPHGSTRGYQKVNPDPYPDPTDPRVTRRPLNYPRFLEQTAAQDRSCAKEKGTLAVCAMFFAIVAASIVYWRRFLKFSAVGMVGIDDREECHSSGLVPHIFWGLGGVNTAHNNTEKPRRRALGGIPKDGSRTYMKESKIPKRDIPK
ncbi:hypothetical protein C8J57DRAFT_1239386 [Mycena rebaudengoi]|nr:hypothetical protein C8J57DRAFT_1239386 [Mycena rebaudengoi]